MINRRLWPIVLFLFLITSWTYAGTIAVNSLEDTNTRDDAVTLREAILLSEGSLTFDVLAAAEQDQVFPPVGRGIADAINFGISGTIMLPSGLPNITDNGTVIDASSQWSGLWPGGEPGVILDGTNAGVDGLVFTGAANCHTRGLFVTRFGGFDGSGIVIHRGSRFNHVGGTGAGWRNIISGNGTAVDISGMGVDSNVVFGNYLGTDVTGTADLGNSRHGVGLRNGARSNIIGGAGLYEGNIIAFNDWSGVSVGGTGTDFNTISGNSIHDNTGPGIDLTAGGNGGIRVPAITWCSLAGDTLTVSGDYPTANATVEVFRTDSSGQEGQTYLGSLVTSEIGEFSYSLSVMGKEISIDDAIVITTTDTNGNTSEFSPPLTWTESATSPPDSILVNIDGRKLSVGEGGVLYHNGKPFRAIGVNYCDVLEKLLWDPSNTAHQHGFAQLAVHGIPFVRFMTHYWPIQLEMYENDRETYLQCFDSIIQAAEKYGIGLIPSLFWATFAVPDLVGEPLNQWGNPDSETMAFMRRYTRDIVSRYKNSPAIWGWEFGNEYSLAVDLPIGSEWRRPPVEPGMGTPVTRGPEDDLNTDMIVIALKEFAEVVRSIDSTRPITTGNSIPRNFAEDTRRGNRWSELDTRDDFKTNISLVTPSPHDMVSIHLYPEEALYERFMLGYHLSYSELISLAVETSAQNGKALFVGEFGANDVHHGGSEQAAQIIQEMIDASVENDVSLAAMWNYNRGYGEPSGWNITPTNSRSYLLGAIRDANQAISYKLAGEQYTNYPWDVNGDGKVDVLDLVFVAKFFGRNVTAPLYLDPDVNDDGIVNILDIILVAQHFGEVYSPAAPPKNMWKVEQEHIPLLIRIYNTMENNPSSDPDFLATKNLLQRLISDTRASKTEVFQNYPNPFNPDTWIPYQLQEDSDVVIKVYTSTGQLVRTLNLGHKSAGVYISKEKAAYWDGRNEEGEKTASGVYFYNIQAGDFTATKKMTIVE